MGRGGLRAGEAWAVGTIGLLGASDVGTQFDAAVRGSPRHRSLSLPVASLVIWPVVTPRSSLADACRRRLLSVVHSPLTVARVLLRRGAPHAAPCAAYQYSIHQRTPRSLS